MEDVLIFPKKLNLSNIDRVEVKQYLAMLNSNKKIEKQIETEDSRCIVENLSRQFERAKFHITMFEIRYGLPQTYA